MRGAACDPMRRGRNGTAANRGSSGSDANDCGCGFAARSGLTASPDRGSEAALSGAWAAAASFREAWAAAHSDGSAGEFDSPAVAAGSETLSELLTRDMVVPQ